VEFVLDLSRLTWIAPCAIAAMTVAVQHGRAQTHLLPGSRILAPEAAGVNSYLQRMDFYRVLRVNAPELFHRGPERQFMPAVAVDLSTGDEAVSDATRRIRDAVANMCRITPSVQGALHSGVSEIIGNGRHAESVVGVVAVAQAWPHKSTIEVAVADAGIGIATTLRRRALHAHLDDGEALLAATQEGVSGVDEVGRGNGLWLVREMLRRNDGRMVILSSGSRLTATRALW
jgi:hypothetical protein